MKLRFQATVLLILNFVCIYIVVKTVSQSYVYFFNESHRLLTSKPISSNSMHDNISPKLVRITCCKWCFAVTRQHNSSQWLSLYCLLQYRAFPGFPVPVKHWKKAVFVIESLAEMKWVNLINRNCTCSKELLMELNFH